MFNLHRNDYYSMSPLAHLTISIMIGFALEIKYSRKYLFIVALGFIGVLPDIDHFFPTSNGIGLFHNLTVLFTLPLVILLVLFLIGDLSKKNVSGCQRFVISATVVFLAHILLDLNVGGAVSVSLTSNGALLQLSDAAILQSASLGMLLSLRDLTWVMLAVSVLLGNIAQKSIYLHANELRDAEEEDWRLPLPEMGTRSAKYSESDVQVSY